MSTGPSAGAQGGFSRKHAGYAVDVVRDGAWWMVYIPDLGGLTQARRLSEVTAMAREWVALDRDVSIDDVQIWLRRLDVNGADVGLIQEDAAGERPDTTASEAQSGDTPEAFSPYDVSDYLVTPRTQPPTSKQPLRRWAPTPLPWTVPSPQSSAPAWGARRARRRAHHPSRGEQVAASHEQEPCRQPHRP